MSKKLTTFIVVVVVLAVLAILFRGSLFPKTVDTSGSAAAGSTLPTGTDNGLPASENAAR